MPGDIYWNNVVLALPFSSNFANQSTVITSAVTNVSVQISATQKKFGAGSAYFNGSSRLDYTGFATTQALFNGDFTIEGWFYPTSVSTPTTALMSTCSSTSSSGVFIRSWSSINHQIIPVLNGVQSYPIGVNLAAGVWSHAAYTRQGSTLRAFLNGVLVGTATVGLSGVDSGIISIGTEQVNVTSRPFIGYMQDFRITKGVARYTATFNVSSTPFEIGPYIAPKSGTISGIVQLDELPRVADLYLVDLNTCPTVKSHPDTGAYAFTDPGDHSIIPASDKLLVICHYGTGVRPLAHGPVVPVITSGE